MATCRGAGGQSARRHHARQARHPDSPLAAEAEVRFNSGMIAHRRRLPSSALSTAVALGDNGVRAQGSPDTMRVWGERR